jgi:hypothetical protein
MIDPVSLIIGGGLLAAGYGSGRIGRARRHPKPRKPLPVPKPVCGCGHGIHDHDPTTNKCHSQIKAYRWNSSYGRETLDKYVACTCRQYSGPQPLPEIFAPEIGG